VEPKYLLTLIQFRYGIFKRGDTMSVQNVKAFFEKVEGDQLLQEKLKNLAVKFKGQNEKGIKELVKLAKDEGIPFTVTDFANAEAEARQRSDNEVIWLKRRFEIKGSGGCSAPPCGSGGAAYDCPAAGW
jgi:predicted ribosomally synthesized peptide with nif11-like leader